MSRLQREGQLLPDSWFLGRGGGWHNNITDAVRFPPSPSDWVGMLFYSSQLLRWYINVVSSLMISVFPLQFAL